MYSLARIINLQHLRFICIFKTDEGVFQIEDSDSDEGPPPQKRHKTLSDKPKEAVKEDTTLYEPEPSTSWADACTGKINPLHLLQKNNYSIPSLIFMLKI